MVRLLGPTVLNLDERWLPIDARIPAAVLATLAVRAGESVTLPALVDAIWLERPPATANQAIYNAISRLRQLSEGSRLRFDTCERGYRAELTRDEVDVLLFEDLLADARAHRPRDPAQARALLERALELWRGSPYDGLGLDSVGGICASQLDELRLAAIEERVNVEMELGDHELVIGELQSLTRTHPLRERFWAQLMLALYRCGRQAESLQIYPRARRYLVRELGCEPSPALRRLHAAILRQLPALDVVAPARAPVAGADGLLDAIIGGDLPALHAEAARAATAGASPAEIGTRVLAPALEAVGQLRAAGALRREDELVACATAAWLVEQMREPPRPIRGCAVVACVEGEAHTLGARMAAAVLEAAGFATLFLGADVAMADLAAVCERVRPQIVGLSATVARREQVAATALALLHGPNPPRLLVAGGRGALGLHGIPELITVASTHDLEAVLARVSGELDPVGSIGGFLSDSYEEASMPERIDVNRLKALDQDDQDRISEALKSTIDIEVARKQGKFKPRPATGGDEFRSALTKLATDTAYREKALVEPELITRDFGLDVKQLQALRQIAVMSGADVRAVDVIRSAEIARSVSATANLAAVDVDVSCCSCCCCCCGETALLT